MTLKLELPAQVAAKLLRKAEEQGVPIETIAIHALESVEEPVERRPVTPESMRRALGDLAEFLPKDLPSIPMDALRRENL